MLKRSRIVYKLGIAALIVAGQASFSAETTSEQVVEFPKPSVGRIYATTANTIFGNRGLQATNLAAAEGKVKKAPGVGFVLKLNYAGGSDLSFLSRLPSDALVGLDTNDIEIDTSNLSAIQHQKALRRLDFRNADIKDSDCASFKNLPIEFADLSKTMICGSGLAVVKTLTRLRSLSVSFCPLDKTAAAAIALAPALKELRISNCNLNDSDLENLTKIKTLTLLKASSNRGITDVGIGYLPALSDLKSLDLSGTNTTVNCLSSLQKLKNLKTLSISSPKLTVQDIAKMSLAMPKCRVQGEKQTNLPMMLFDPLH